MVFRSIPLLVFLFLFVFSTNPYHAKAAPPYKIVAGTELIADITRDLLPGQVELLTLLPGSSCPGHHDMRASDMIFFGKADLVILHLWQKNSPGIPEAVQAAKLPQSAVQLVDMQCSLLVPENQIQASLKVRDFLLKLPGVDAPALEKRFSERVQRITTLAEECQTLLIPYRGTPALSASMQEEFVRWTGMDVVGHYGRAEDLSPSAMMELVDKGKKSGVLVVVDNLQSGAEAGMPLAKELHAAHVTFSNFPMSSPATPTYEALLKQNTTLLCTALSGRQANKSDNATSLLGKKQ